MHWFFNQISGGAGGGKKCLKSKLRVDFRFQRMTVKIENLCFVLKWVKWMDFHIILINPLPISRWKTNFIFQYTHIGRTDLCLFLFVVSICNITKCNKRIFWPTFKGIHFIINKCSFYLILYSNKITSPFMYGQTKSVRRTKPIHSWY